MLSGETLGFWLANSRRLAILRSQRSSFSDFPALIECDLEIS
jgi:hypothetical protein